MYPLQRRHPLTKKEKDDNNCYSASNRSHWSWQWKITQKTSRITFNKIHSPPRKKRKTTRKILSGPVNKTKSNALLNNSPIDVFRPGFHIVPPENIPRLLFYQRELHEDTTMLSYMDYTGNYNVMRYKCNKYQFNLRRINDLNPHPSE